MQATGVPIRLKDSSPNRHVAKGGRGRPPPPPPPWRPGGPFSARAARRKGPTRPREAQFLESLEFLRATRALSERPEGPMDVQRAPVQVRGPPGALSTLEKGPFERSGRGPFEAPSPPPPGRNPGKRACLLICIMALAYFGLIIALTCGHILK